MPPAEELELQGLRSDVASLKATVSSQAGHIERIDAWLQKISEDLRKKPVPNSMPVYVALITGVSVLLALGQFALAPVQNNVREIKNDIVELRMHDSDGHPEAVLNRIKLLDRDHMADMAINADAIQRDENRMDALTTRVAVLETIADERTMRFIRTLEQRDKISEMRSSDRLTGSEHRIHAQSIEQRLERLEESGRPGKGKGHGVLDQ